MFKPFKYWGDYTEDEHINWMSELPSDPFMSLDIPRNISIVKTEPMTAELEYVLSLMCFETSKSPTPNVLSPIAQMMSPKLRGKKFFKLTRRRSSSGSS